MGQPEEEDEEEGVIKDEHDDDAFLRSSTGVDGAAAASEELDYEPSESGGVEQEEAVTEPEENQWDGEGSEEGEINDIEEGELRDEEEEEDDVPPRQTTAQPPPISANKGEELGRPPTIWQPSRRPVVARPHCRTSSSSCRPPRPAAQLTAEEIQRLPKLLDLKTEPPPQLLYDNHVVQRCVQPADGGHGFSKRSPHAGSAAFRGRTLPPVPPPQRQWFGKITPTGQVAPADKQISPAGESKIETAWEEGLRQAKLLIGRRKSHSAESPADEAVEELSSLPRKPTEFGLETVSEKRRSPQFSTDTSSSALDDEPEKRNNKPAQAVRRPASPVQQRHQRQVEPNDFQPTSRHPPFSHGQDESIRSADRQIEQRQRTDFRGHHRSPARYRDISNSDERRTALRREPVYHSQQQASRGVIWASSRGRFGNFKARGISRRRPTADFPPRFDNARGRGRAAFAGGWNAVRRLEQQRGRSERDGRRGGKNDGVRSVRSADGGDLRSRQWREPWERASAGADCRTRLSQKEPSSSVSAAFEQPRQQGKRSPSASSGSPTGRGPNRNHVNSRDCSRSSGAGLRSTRDDDSAKAKLVKRRKLNEELAFGRVANSRIADELKKPKSSYGSRPSSEISKDVRREQLLKQLKAVEEAIAKKRDSTALKTSS